MKNIKLFVVAVGMLSMVGCSITVTEVQPGEVKSIPCTDNWVLGTDSTLVIIGPDGNTINTIKRH